MTSEKLEKIRVVRAVRAQPNCCKVLVTEKARGRLRDLLELAEDSSIELVDRIVEVGSTTDVAHDVREDCGETFPPTIVGLVTHESEPCLRILGS